MGLVLYMCMMSCVSVYGHGSCFFSSRRRHTRSSTVSWARRCVEETGSMHRRRPADRRRRDQLVRYPFRERLVVPDTHPGLSLIHI